MSTLLELNAVSFGYHRPIVSKISLKIDRGDYIHFVGDNGAGKSTLLRGILGLIPCFSGEILFHIPQHDIGYIPQESHIDRTIPASVADIIATASPNQWKKSTAEILAALEQVKMEDHYTSSFGALSGGQRRRVLLARALMGSPKLLILDEPTANTDKDTACHISEILETLSLKQKVAILMTTHEDSRGEHIIQKKVTPEGLV